MKLQLIIAILLFACISLQAQANHDDITIFSTDGEKFTVYYSGRQHNDKPSSEVRIENRDKRISNVQIIFDNPSIPMLSKKHLRISKRFMKNDNFSARFSIKKVNGIYVIKCVKRRRK